MLEQRLGEYIILTKTALCFILKNKDRSKRGKKQRGASDKRESKKNIWSWLISKRMQNGLYFEGNQNNCGGQRFVVRCLLMFCDNGTRFWHTASLVTVFSSGKQLKCVYVCVCGSACTCICIHKRYSLQACSGWFVHAKIQYVHVWMVKSPFQKNSKGGHSLSEGCISVALQHGALCVFPGKTIAYLLPALSASDNISIQALFSTQTAMSYLAAQAHRINCWSTHSL